MNQLLAVPDLPNSATSRYCSRFPPTQVGVRAQLPRTPRPKKRSDAPNRRGLRAGTTSLRTQEGNAQRLPLKALGQALQLALWTYASIIFLSVLPCFGLRVLQEPSGDDLRAPALRENRGTR